MTSSKRGILCTRIFLKSVRLPVRNAEAPTDKTLRTAIRQKLINVAEADGYGTALTEKRYVWGATAWASASSQAAGPMLRGSTGYLT